MEKTKLARLAVEALKKAYPEAVCSLEYTDPLQLLIATRLAAQCTDARVNLVTPALFERFPTLEAFCASSAEEIEPYIRSCGLYKTKAKEIFAMCHALRDLYGGVVPDTVEALTKLPGVGRKTANVVLSVGFGQQRIAVDTHVFRVANRIGLVHEKDVLKTELALMKRIPEERWSKTHHSLIFHGRNCCDARKPDCDRCVISDLCDYVKEQISGKTGQNEKKKDFL